MAPGWGNRRPQEPLADASDAGVGGRGLAHFARSITLEGGYAQERPADMGCAATDP